MDFNWKLLFNPDPSRPAQEMLFLTKKKLRTHPTIKLNNIQVERTSYQKHLGILFDEKMNFKQHVYNAIIKVNKGISVIKKLRYSLPRKSLLIMYKVFLTPLFDYGNIICHQSQNESFCKKLEPVQYKAALAITEIIQGTYRENIYQKLGLE